MAYTGNKINRKKLLSLIKKNGLTPQDVADVLGRKITTVQTWMSTSGVDIPDHSIQLLQYKLK
jgi:DNA-directed RNA polymerase specialized sigma24 family protein